ncbi:MAG: DNA primase [Phycisphaerales bacterium JB060]
MSDRGDIERVLAATDIVRVVRERVDLREKGREWVGLCPFHNDRSPSMFVSPGKQIFKCFACGAGGDALSFVQKYDGVEFPQALEHLAEAAGVELTPRGRQAPRGQGRSERAAALEANSFAQDYFRRSLVDPQAGRAAREMVERRGISPEMVEAFGIGSAPAGWDGLVQAVLREKRPVEAFAAAQLVKAREQGGGHYDVFRNRLMFPIHDQGGRVIAFGGRRLSEDDPAKYLNSPESPVFKKSGVLYGLWKANAGIRQAGFCIVTEGYTDTIACHQAGFTNTVATLGTAFTAEHAVLLRRLCSRVVLLFDGDEAGLTAADRAVGVLFAEPLDVQIAILGQGQNAKDPDELLKLEGGRERFAAMVRSAGDLLEFRFDRLRSRLEGQGRSALLKGVEEEVRWLGEHGLRQIEPARQDRLLAQLGNLSGLDQYRLRELALSAPRRARGGQENEADTLPRPVVLSAADRLVGVVLLAPAAWGMLSEDDAITLRDTVAGGPSEPVAAAVDHLAAEGEAITMAALRGELSEASLQWASTLVAWAEREATSVGGGAAGEADGEALRGLVAGLVRQIYGRQSSLEVDPFERVRARREQLARFQNDPGRIARPS